jgi:hypothetical protein
MQILKYGSVEPYYIRRTSVARHFRNDLKFELLIAARKQLSKIPAWPA